MDRSENPFPADWQRPDLSPAAVRLAAALAERLTAAVPAQFQLRAEGGGVAFYEGAKWWSTYMLDLVDDPPEEEEEAGGETWPLADRVVRAVWGVLNRVQDDVSEALHEPWPALAGGRRAMAMPGARADGARVFLWYGPAEDAAVISFAPIERAELTPEV